MHRNCYSLVLVLALASTAIPLRAAQSAAQPQSAKRVWTTDDMNDLRARGLISIVGPETTAPSSETASATPAPAPVYASRTEDPAWYAKQAAELREELNARATALADARDNLSQARNLRGATGSFNMSAPDEGAVTPEAGIAALEAEVNDAQAQLDELADLARRNDIPPGVLRGQAA